MFIERFQRDTLGELELIIHAQPHFGDQIEENTTEFHLKEILFLPRQSSEKRNRDMDGGSHARKMQRLSSRRQSQSLTRSSASASKQQRDRSSEISLASWD